uniref:Reverse transcriptase zinc-binding domain-containing protein n=1 Tax=Fagus sylvatica TaxID=28930 RepID=A0A2N9H8A6_FAGSY
METERDFLWGGWEMRLHHLVSWDKVCAPKVGGLRMGHHRSGEFGSDLGGWRTYSRCMVVGFGKELCRLGFIFLWILWLVKELISFWKDKWCGDTSLMVRSLPYSLVLPIEKLQLWFWGPDSAGVRDGTTFGLLIGMCGSGVFQLYKVPTWLLKLNIFGG